MIKFGFPIPLWLGNLLSRRTVETADTHGRSGRGWSFLKGIIEVNMTVRSERQDD